jgi:hypothetical protein
VVCSYGIMKKKTVTVSCVLGTCLGSLLVSPHVLSTKRCELSTVWLPCFTDDISGADRSSAFAQGHRASKWQSWDLNPGCVWLQGGHFRPSHYGNTPLEHVTAVSSPLILVESQHCHRLFEKPISVET